MQLTSPSAGLDPGGRPHPGWPAIGWGLLVFFGLPILAVLALVMFGCGRIGAGIRRRQAAGLGSERASSPRVAARRTRAADWSR